MKKTYIIPEIEISLYSSENIVTASGDFTAKTMNELQNGGNVFLDGQNLIDKAQIISFTF